MYGSRVLSIEPGPRDSEDRLATVGEKFAVFRYEPSLWDHVSAAYLRFEAEGSGTASSTGELRLYRQSDDLQIATIPITATLGVQDSYDLRIDNFPLIIDGSDYYFRVYGGDTLDYPTVRNARIHYLVGSAGGVRLAVPTLDQVVGESRTLSIWERFPFVADDEENPSVPFLDVLPTKDAFAVILNADPVTLVGSTAYSTVNGGNHYQYDPERHGGDLLFYLEVGGGTREIGGSDPVPGAWDFALQYSDTGEIVNASEISVDDDTRSTLVRSAAFRLEGGREVVPIYKKRVGTNYFPSVPAIRLIAAVTGGSDAPILRNGWSEDVAAGDFEQTGTSWDSIGALPVLPHGSFGHAAYFEAVHKRKSGSGNAETRLSNAGTGTALATLTEGTTTATLDVSGDLAAAMDTDGIALAAAIGDGLWTADVEIRMDTAGAVARTIGARLAGTAVNDPISEVLALTGRWTLDISPQDNDLSAAWVLTADTVDLDRSAAWAVEALVDLDLDAAWRVSTTATLDQAATWVLLDTVDFDRSAAWSVEATVSAELSAGWLVQATQDLDRSSAWSLSRTRDSDLPASWVGLGDVALEAAWSVLTAPEDDVASEWAVSIATDLDRSASWAIDAATDLDLSAAWMVDGTVDLNVSASWEVSVGTNYNLTALWTVQALAEVNLSALWRVSVATDLDASAAWMVDGTRSSDLSAAWSVLATLEQDLGAAWSLAVPTDLDLTSTWVVDAGSKILDRSAAWSVLAQITSDLTAEWVVDVPSPQVELAASWLVFTQPDTDLSATWVVVPPSYETLSSPISPTATLSSTISPTVDLDSTIVPTPTLESLIDES